jgi:FkbM family methyltransferase
MDVGARGGVPEEWVEFLRLLAVDALEPDKENCARQKASSPSQVSWYPCGLARTTGTHDLYVLNRASGSSLYPPNEDVLPRFSPTWYSGLRTVQPIECYALADFLEHFERPTPELIKLDTQGSELDILSSLGTERWADVQCVVTEVEFRELYRGQPLFPEVDAFLREQGFDLVDLRTHRTYLAKGDRSRYYLETYLNLAQGRPDLSGQLVAGDALYFRRVDEPPAEHDVLVRRLLVYCIYHYFDLALELLERGRDAGVLDQSTFKTLVGEVCALAPRPALWQRSDRVGEAVRRLFKRFGLDVTTYKAFWTRRAWPDQ